MTARERRALVQGRKMHVLVEYRVPVLCEVDLDSGEVRAVWVADDEVTPTGKCFDGRGQPLTGSKSSAAKALVEAPSVEWPRWRFGR